MKRTIFLDIDGVLATKSSYKRAPTDDPQGYLDPALVARFNRLCDYVDADVIVISAWREYEWGTLTFFQEHISPRVSAMTPQLGEPRWKEVEQRVEEGMVFVVLEDENDMGPFRGRWVKTSFGGPHQGLGRKHVRRALQLFGYKEADAISREIG